MAWRVELRVIGRGGGEQGVVCAKGPLVAQGDDACHCLAHHMAPTVNEAALYNHLGEYTHTHTQKHTNSISS